MGQKINTGFWITHKNHGLLFPAGMQNKNLDYFIDAHFSSDDNHIDFLCFFDSRASNLQDPKTSICNKLAEYLRSRRKTFLILVRPLDITVFFSMFNFLSCNKLRPAQLLTNVGFVDLTPKKKEIVDDLQVQKELLFADVDCELVEMGSYHLASNETQMLYSLDISPCIPFFVEKLVSHFSSVFLMETPEFHVNCEFSRPRPEYFFRQLRKTNKFLIELRKSSNRIHFIPCPVIPDDYSLYSHDGVHYTNAVHVLWFERIVEFIS